MPACLRSAQRASAQNCDRYFQMLPGILPDDRRVFVNYASQKRRGVLYILRPPEKSAWVDPAILQSENWVLPVSTRGLLFLRTPGSSMHFLLRPQPAKPSAHRHIRYQISTKHFHHHPADGPRRRYSDRHIFL